MELGDAVTAAKKGWFAIVASSLLGALIGSTITLTSDLVYEAKTEVFISSVGGTSSSELLQGSSFILDRMQSYARAMTSDLVLQPVIDELDLATTVPLLADRISTSVVEDTVVIVVTARAADSTQAAQVANAVAEQFLEISSTLEPQRADESGVIEATVIDSAVQPERPVSPHPFLNLLIGMVLGGALGTTSLIVREATNRRVQSEADVHALTSAPILAQIPQDQADRRSMTLLQTNPARSESIRQLRTNLQFLTLPLARRSYVVTSSVMGEGKTVTALDLATTLSEAGQRVCFVEADLRQAGAGHYLGLPKGEGLSDVLIGSVSRSTATTQLSATLDIILAGSRPPNPADLLARPTMGALLRELEDVYDVVIVDSPPLLPVTDGAILARLCSGALLVVRIDRRAVNRDELADGLGIIDGIGAQLLGVVLNHCPPTPRQHSRAHTAYQDSGATTVPTFTPRRTVRQGEGQPEPV